MSPDNPISLQAETASLESGPQLFNLHPPTHAGRNLDGLHQVSSKGKVIQLSNAQKAQDASVVMCMTGFVTGQSQAMKSQNGPATALVCGINFWCQNYI